MAAEARGVEMEATAMRLDTHYIEQVEAAEQDVRSGIGLYGYAGSNALTDADFRDYLTKLGLTYEERVIAGVGTWAEAASEIRYQHPETGRRYAYVLTHRTDMDSWGQDIYVFGEPVPDDRLADTLEAIRRQERDLDALVTERVRAIQTEYPPYWGMINNSPTLTGVAWALRTQGWTPEIERELRQWGAYGRHPEKGLENPFVRSLLTYADLIAQQPDPEQYVAGLKRGH